LLQVIKNCRRTRSITILATNLAEGMAKLLQVTRPIAMYNCISHPKKELDEARAPATRIKLVSSVAKCSACVMRVSLQSRPKLY